MTLEKVYNEHAEGIQQQFIFATLNGLREHLDRIFEICKIVRELRPASVLDAPCATGLISAMVNMYLDGPKVTALDIAPRYCDMARDLFGVDAECSDLLTYEPLNKFELVMCMEMLEHVHNPQDYVSKIAALSCKWVLLSVPVEAQDVDGTFHVSKVHPTALWDWAIAANVKVERLWLLPSLFCEKPKWLGWMFLLGRVDHV